MIARKIKNMVSKSSEKARLNVAYFRCCYIAAAALLLSVCVTGCGGKEQVKEPEKAVSRNADKEYNESLRKMAQSKRSLVAEKAALLAELNDVKERARRLLPEGTADAAVEEYILKNAEKFPAWETIQAKISKVNENIKLDAEKARTAIFDRIKRENAERKAARKAAAQKEK